MLKKVKRLQSLLAWPEISAILYDDGHKRITMIRRTILILIVATSFIFPISVKAQSSEPSKGIYKDEAVERLRADLCSIVSIGAGFDQTIGSKLENALAKFGNLKKESPDFELRMAEIWNQNSHKMICNTSNSGVYPKQHLFQRSVIKELHIPVLEDFFFRDENTFPIDPNTVSIDQNGVEETIIDYIENIIAEPDVLDKYNKSQIIGLRDIIKDLYGGKRARKLR